MSLELPAKGTHFVARVKINHRRHYITLAEEIVGLRPRTLKQQGDGEFERARRRAQAEHDRLVGELKSGVAKRNYLERVYTAAAGEHMPKVSLPELATAYVAAPRKQPLSPKYAPQARAMLEDFVNFMWEKYPMILHLAEVQHSHALAYISQLESRHYSEGRYNDYLILLRGAFERLRRQAGIHDNPFTGIPTKVPTIIHKRPFTVEELGLILQACADDDFIRPIIVALMCTALRRQAACLLDWRHIDLKEGFVVVNPGKGGNDTVIPIFPLFRHELERLHPRQQGYVFKAQAQMYLKNPDGITWRVKQVLKQSGFTDVPTRETDPKLSMVHPTGQRRVSLRGSHSFRTTWITLAILNGVPLDIVRKITGHRTVDVVFQHYLRPNRDQIRAALATKLPALLGGSISNPGLPVVSPIDEVRDRLANMTQESWAADRQALLQLLNSDQVKSQTYAIQTYI
ncbi:MAG: site-specific integrase [Cephaloticoccus sp.]|nr:site-specific integrase [Cephaloticoccus sp.]